MNYSGFDLDGLNLLHEVQQRVCETAASKLAEVVDNNSDEYKRLSEDLAYYKQRLTHIEQEIENRIRGNLIYSLEDVYKFAAQYDHYLVFDFLRTSEAFKTYGDQVHGKVIYKSKERAALEEALHHAHQRSNGRIFLDSGAENIELAQKLKTNGFLISDVHRIGYLHNGLKEKQYKKPGLKGMPYTVTVKIDPKDFDVEATTVYLLKSKIDSGYTLLPHEYTKYYVNLLILYPQATLSQQQMQYLLNEDKTEMSEAAKILLYRGKFHRQLISLEELKDFEKVLSTRSSARLELVKKELGVSSKQFNEFKVEYPENYKELLVAVSQFETETLSVKKTKHPVYWDFERFIHIYARHYEKFFIKSSTYRGTKFQYSFKDISRIAKHIIEKLEDEIELSLSAGKTYAKYGDQGYYYNGNYYTLRVDTSGRLMQFHPE